MVQALAQDFNKVVGGVLSQQELLRARYMARAGSTTNQFSDEDEDSIGKERDEKEQSANHVFSRAVALLDSQIQKLDYQIDNVKLDLDKLRMDMDQLRQAVAEAEARRAQVEERIIAVERQQEEIEERQRENAAEIATTEEVITTAADENAARAAGLQEGESPTIAVPGTEAGIVTSIEVNGRSVLVMTDALTGEITRPEEMNAETLRNFRAVTPHAIAAGAVPEVDAGTHTATEVVQAQERQMQLYGERSDLSRFSQLLRVESAELRDQAKKLKGELDTLRAQEGDLAAQITTKEAELAQLEEQRTALRTARENMPADATREQITSVLADLGLSREWDNAMLPENDRGLTYATEGMANTRASLRQVNEQMKALGADDPRMAELQAQKDQLLLDRDHYRTIYDGITEGRITGVESLDQAMQDSPYASGWNSFAGAYESVANTIGNVASAVSDSLGGMAGTVANVVTGGLSGVVSSIIGSESVGSAASAYDPEGGTGTSLTGMAADAFKTAASNVIPSAPAPQVDTPAIEAQQQMQQRQQMTMGM